MNFRDSPSLPGIPGDRVHHANPIAEIEDRLGVGRQRVAETNDREANHGRRSAMYRLAWACARSAIRQTVNTCSCGSAEKSRVRTAVMKSR